MRNYLIFIIVVISAFLPAALATESYTCPMHPHYTSDQIGACPICGMDLVPMAGRNEEISSGVTVSPEMIQTMGIRTATVSEQPFGRRVRAYGHLKASSRLEKSVASRLEGWIESLSVTAVGDKVTKGALLYTVYSPDLVAAQRDYLIALRSGAKIRIASAARRLKSLGMQSRVVASLKKSKKIMERMPIYSEGGGVVSMLWVRDGDYVKPGVPVMRLQSYDEVWVMASVAEQDIAMIKKDLPALLNFPDAGVQQRTGLIDYIYPVVDEKTRTGQIRIVVNNRDGLLRPGGYADVTFMLEEKTRLSVPSESVLRDSAGAHVVALMGEGRFKPIAVRTGIVSRDRTEILAGLEVGETVVVSGQFLLDSEASLREGFRKLTPPKKMANFTATTPLSELPVDAGTLALIDHFIDASLYFHEALVDGYTLDPYFVDGLIKAGDDLAVRFESSTLMPVIQGSIAALNTAKEAGQAKQLQVALAQLMVAIEPWLLRGAPIHYRDLDLALYRENESGRFWLQENNKSNNPYGNGIGVVIPWPDPMAGVNPDISIKLISPEVRKNMVRGETTIDGHNH